MLQVFAVEPGTSGVEGGGDDRGVVEAVAVARLDIEGAVKFLQRFHLNAGRCAILSQPPAKCCTS